MRRVSFAGPKNCDDENEGGGGKWPKEEKEIIGRISEKDAERMMQGISNRQT